MLRPQGSFSYDRSFPNWNVPSDRRFALGAPLAYESPFSGHVPNFGGWCGDTLRSYWTGNMCFSEGEGKNEVSRDLRRFWQVFFHTHDEETWPWSFSFRKPLDASICRSGMLCQFGKTFGRRAQTYIAKDGQLYRQQLRLLAEGGCTPGCLQGGYTMFGLIQLVAFLWGRVLNPWDPLQDGSWCLQCMGQHKDEGHFVGRWHSTCSHTNRFCHSAVPWWTRPRILDHMKPFMKIGSDLLLPEMLCQDFQMEPELKVCFSASALMACSLR